MIKVDYPTPEFRIKKEDGKEMIFDIIRKQWMILTEEEWVRQNIIQFLIQKKKYPAALIAVEKEFQLGELKKRFDILIYDQHHIPWMMIECKSGTTALNMDVVNQLLRYHISVQTKYLIITNGTHTYGWYKDDNSLEEISEFPDWIENTG